MKVLHTADLHLDRSFEGMKQIPHAWIKKLAKANHQILTAIVELAIKNQVDLVILAGDTFHQSRTSIQTQAIFIEAMKRLEQAEIPVAMIFGNHDYYQADRYWFSFPKNMLLFSSEEVTTQYLTTKKQETVALTGFSYEHAWINEPKLSDFPSKDPTAALHIGIYHGDTTNQEINNYAPFTVGEMKAKGYDYWALGHIHQPEIVSAAPLIVYPGTPQGHTIKEQQVQGVAIVTIEPGHATVCFEPVATVCWQVVTCSLAGIRTLQAAMEQIQALLLTEVAESQQLLQIKALQLVDTQQLGDEFIRSYASGELLQYIQETVLEKSSQSIFIFRISDHSQIRTDKIRINAAPVLLEQLEKNYLQPAIFTNTLEELVTNPLFSSGIQLDDDWRKKSIQRANEKITKDFLIQEERP